jgi:prophage antirepressor-like protein
LFYKRLRVSSVAVYPAQSRATAMQAKTSALEIAHLYIVENTLGLVKIGIAGNPAKRIKSLEAASGAPITRQHISPPCLRCRELEAAMHRHFAEHRQAGEWFQMPFESAVSALADFQAQPVTPPGQAITPFEFHGHAVRTVNQDGDTWFVARDVCECLELDNVSMALTRLRDSEKGVKIIDTPGGNQKISIVNEPGLYRLIFTSNKPEAQAFQDWVYHDVLPAIRATGGYSTGNLHPQGQITPEIQAIIQASVKAEFAMLYGKLEAVSEQVENRLLTQRYHAGHQPDNVETVRQFITECCQTSPSQHIRTAHLYAGYQEWEVKRGELAMTMRHFGVILGQLGYQKARRKSGIFRRGLVLGGAK